MLASDRQRLILKEIEQRGSVLNTELVRKLDVSESTIRRDLAVLEEEGQLIRVHGGAEIASNILKEPTFSDKLVEHPDIKDKIAEFAVSKIDDGQAIFIDAGTTTLAMFPYLRNKRQLKIITNGLSHALNLTELGFDVIMLGGTIKQGTQAVIGSQALEQFASYYVDLAFLGTNGIDLEQGFTTPDPQEARIKQLALKQSQKTFVLADATKFNRISFAKFSDLENCSVITQKLSQSIKNKYDKTLKMEEV